MKGREPNRQGEQQTAIDWMAVHRRLESAQIAIERGLALTDEEKKSARRLRKKFSDKTSS